MRLGLTGFSALTLSQLFQLRSLADDLPNSVGGGTRHSNSERTAIVLVWLRGGASHLETFDMKPLASSEFRGPYQPIATNVPGIEICELLPRLATIESSTILCESA